jgi:DtxR family transcriptional regulator, Mn-dependent transcriptional regulator
LKITISKENYLKAIAEAEAEGEAVIAATLARWLDVSPPAVTMALRRLKRDGFIQVQAKDGRITLLPEGRKIADRLLYRHHLIERMLAELFGMEWYMVHDEAEQLEHSVSEEFERLLASRLGEEGACPHGNPLRLDTPEVRRQRGWQPMFEMEPGTRARVVSVFERDRQLLEYLNGLGIRPGAVFEVAARYYDDTIGLRLQGRTVQLGRKAAERIWAQDQAKELSPSNPADTCAAHS